MARPLSEEKITCPHTRHIDVVKTNLASVIADHDIARIALANGQIGHALDFGTGKANAVNAVLEVGYPGDAGETRKDERVRARTTSYRIGTRAA